MTYSRYFATHRDGFFFGTELKPDRIIFGRFGEKSLYQDKKFFGQDDPLKDKVSLTDRKKPD